MEGSTKKQKKSELMSDLLQKLGSNPKQVRKLVKNKNIHELILGCINFDFVEVLTEIFKEFETVKVTEMEFYAAMFQKRWKIIAILSKRAEIMEIFSDAKVDMQAISKDEQATELLQDFLKNN